MSIIRRVSLFFIALLAIASIVTYWAVGQKLPTFSQLPVFAYKDAPMFEPKNIIKVGTYNIGHSQGVKEFAYDFRGKDHTLKKLEELADVINNLDLDVLMMQEVDLDSNRTHHINQIEFITKKTAHPYYACANVWEKNYVPYPFWPINHHIGYVRAANCIISRYPLTKHERIIFAVPKEYPYWYQLGYLDRAIQRVDVSIGEKTITLLNVHLEAWIKKAREEQIKIVSDYMDKIDNDIILGGDFNTIVMEEGVRVKDFADDPENDFVNETTLDWFFKNQKGLKIFNLPATNDKFSYFTFPSNDPNRRLDHIFIKGDIEFKDYQIAKEASEASDHLPIITNIILDKKNNFVVDSD